MNPRFWLPHSAQAWHYVLHRIASLSSSRRKQPAYLLIAEGISVPLRFQGQDLTDPASPLVNLLQVSLAVRLGVGPLVECRNESVQERRDRICAGNLDDKIVNDCIAPGGQFRGAFPADGSVTWATHVKPLLARLFHSKVRKQPPSAFAAHRGLVRGVVAIAFALDTHLLVAELIVVAVHGDSFFAWALSRVRRGRVVPFTRTF